MHFKIWMTICFSPHCSKLELKTLKCCWRSHPQIQEKLENQIRREFFFFVFLKVNNYLLLWTMNRESNCTYDHQCLVSNGNARTSTSLGHARINSTFTDEPLLIYDNKGKLFFSWFPEKIWLLTKKGVNSTAVVMLFSMKKVLVRLRTWPISLLLFLSKEIGARPVWKRMVLSNLQKLVNECEEDLGKC